MVIILFTGEIRYNSISYILPKKVIKLGKKEMSTKKVLLISIMLIALTALLTGVGTMAYFSSIQTSGPNLLSTGTISINVNGQDPWSGTFNATLADVKPGLKRWGNATIQNTGTEPGGSVAEHYQCCYEQWFKHLCRDSGTV